MWRTGRREGQVANTSFFCESTDGVLQAIALIELAKVGWVESIAVPKRCWPVLIHQLLAMSLAFDGVTAEVAWAHLSRVPDFQEISREEYDRLIAWMLEDESLRLAAGRLVLGPKSEQQFGRRNFMELFAVFSSPQSYTVLTEADRPLGTLTQEFVDRLVDGVSCFLLGGRAWAVERVQHDDRRVVVSPAPRGRQPTWGGFLPQFLGREICERVRRVLLEDEAFTYLDAATAELLERHREGVRELMGDGKDRIRISDGELRWWTFAGGKINATLRYALEGVEPNWKATPDNFLIKVRGGDVTPKRFHVVLARLRDPSFWQDEGFWASVAASLPGYRLSKFQPLMPDWVEREVVAEYLLDLAGASEWVQRLAT